MCSCKCLYDTLMLTSNNNFEHVKEKQCEELDQSSS